MPNESSVEAAARLASSGIRLSAHELEIFDRSPIGVVIADAQRRILYANPEAMRLFDVASYVGRTLDDTFTQTAAHDLLERQFGQRLEGVIGSYRAPLRRLSDSRVVHADITGVPLKDDGGKVIGSVGYIRSIDDELLIDSIHRLNGELENGHKLLLEVAKILAQAFGADMVLVTRYSETLRHANPFFVYSPGKARRAVEWRKRWIALDSAQQEDIAQARTRIISGLRAYIDCGVWRSAAGDPFVSSILQDGLEAVLSRPIRRRGAVIGAVSLLAKRADTFNEQHRRLIDELPVDATLEHVLGFSAQQQERERFKLLRELTRSVTVKQAADVLTRRLTEIFGWSHVSLFRVDYAESRLHLLAQHGPGSAPILLPDDYQQPIDSGLLGHVVRDRQLVNVGNVQAEADYVASVIGIGVCSELCCPINFERDDTVRWIINVEDRTEDAFSDNECTWLQDIAHEVGALMERLSTLHFLNECFRSTSDPIIVAGPNLDIRKANPAAAALLGFADPKEVQGQVSSLFCSSGDYERICAAGAAYETDVLVRRNDPAEPAIPVHISRQDLPENVGGVVFVLKDLRHIRRHVELSLLEDVAYEVASETRAPLASASALLESLLPRLQGRQAETVDKALRHLRRVNHGYTRLTLFNREVQPSAAEFCRIDLAAEARAVIADLPLGEAESVRLHPDGRAIVRGDPFQIAFVLESLIAVLVRYAPEREPVEVRTGRSAGCVHIDISGYLPSPQDVDPATARLASRLRADVRLARPLIVRFMQGHGGRFTEHAENGRTAFRVQFPAADEGSA
jgi:PAS domain-containing protein